MTWSYYSSNLGSSSKDAIRLMIGDTFAADPQLQDEEINYLLLQRGSLYGTAAECCRVLAAKFSRSVDQFTGNSKLMYSQMAKAYTDKALEYEMKSTESGAALPFAGGISQSAKELAALDSDTVPPYFQRNMFDNDLPEPSNPRVNPAANDEG